MSLVPTLSDGDIHVVITDLDALRLLRSLSRSGAARSVRESAGVSVVEAAREAEISRRSVMRWERGQTVPHGPGAVRYGRLLDALMRGTP